MVSKLCRKSGSGMSCFLNRSLCLAAGLECDRAGGSSFQRRRFNSLSRLLNAAGMAGVKIFFLGKTLKTGLPGGLGGAWWHNPTKLRGVGCLCRGAAHKFWRKTTKTGITLLNVTSWDVKGKKVAPSMNNTLKCSSINTMA